MKRFFAVLLMIVLLAGLFTSTAVASVKGQKYKVRVTMPKGHDHIYLHDAPSSSKGRNLGRVNNGTIVTGISSVVRKGYTWIYCKCNGKKGYIRKNNLVKVSSSASSSASKNYSYKGRYKVRITMPKGHNHIYLYDAPSSTNGRNLGRINNGTYVTGLFGVKRKGYTWIYCKCNGKNGYIRMNNLMRVK